MMLYFDLSQRQRDETDPRPYRGPIFIDLKRFLKRINLWIFKRFHNISKKT